MAKNDNLTDFLTDLADTIRSVTGATAKINPQDFKSKIQQIANSGGGGTPDYEWGGRGVTFSADSPAGNIAVEYIEYPSGNYVRYETEYDLEMEPFTITVPSYSSLRVRTETYANLTWTSLRSYSCQEKSDCKYWFFYIEEVTDPDDPEEIIFTE